MFQIRIPVIVREPNIVYYRDELEQIRRGYMSRFEFVRKNWSYILTKCSNLVRMDYVNPDKKIVRTIFI